MFQKHGIINMSVFYFLISPSVPGINLAPGSQYVLALRKRRLKLFMLSFLIVLVLGGIWAALYSYEQQVERERDDVQAQIRQVQLAIAELSDSASRVVLFEERLKSLNTLLDNHITWDPMFGDLEKLLLQPVVLKTLNARAEGSRVELEGEAGDVDQIAQTIASLKDSIGHKTIFTSVQCSNIGRKEETIQGAEGVPPTTVVKYGFSAELLFNPSHIKVAKEM